MTEAEARIAIDGMDGSLAQRVYRALHDAILDLTYPPGTVLRKAAISDRLGVSRSPVTEALARLSTEGLVDIVPQSATRVSRFSIAVIREETFLREAIEVAATARVAANPAPDQIALLSRNLRLQGLLVEDGDTVGFFEADEAFHTLLLGFTGFPNVATVTSQLTHQVRRARQLLLPDEGRMAATVREHIAVLDAIQAGDVPAAQAAMSHHLRHLITRLEPLERMHPDYFRPSRKDTA